MALIQKFRETLLRQGQLALEFKAAKEYTEVSCLACGQGPADIAVG